MDSSTNSAPETGKPEDPQGVTETLTSSRSQGRHGLLGRFFVGILGGCIGAGSGRDRRGRAWLCMPAESPLGYAGSIHAAHVALSP